MAFSRNLNIVLLENDIAWGDKEANLAKVKQQMANLPLGTDLVVLPELFSTGFIIRVFPKKARSNKNLFTLYIFLLLLLYIKRTCRI